MKKWVLLSLKPSVNSFFFFFLLINIIIYTLHKPNNCWYILFDLSKWCDDFKIFAFRSQWCIARTIRNNNLITSFSSGKDFYWNNDWSVNSVCRYRVRIVTVNIICSKQDAVYVILLSNLFGNTLVWLGFCLQSNSRIKISRKVLQVKSSIFFLEKGC